MSRLDDVLSQWTRLGAMFDVPPAEETPDLESLLLETAGLVPQSARLLAMAASWLARYRRIVCRHRLAVMVQGRSDPMGSAILGYLLTTVKHHARTDHFNRAIKVCRPLAKPQPLFDTYRRNPAMVRLAKEQTDPLAEPWGLWTPPERLYNDAIRPPDWVMERNPSLQPRALFGGQLTASILVTLQADPAAGKSESALSRACQATRCALRDALDHLELCRLIHRQRTGNTTPITLAGARLH